MHALNVLFLVPIIALLFYVAPSGFYLWMALTIYLGGAAVELVDILCEPASRREFGGLVPTEAAMHFLMAVLPTAAFVPFFVVAPASAWSTTESTLGIRPQWFGLYGIGMLAMGIGVFIFHVVLDVQGGIAIAAARGTPSHRN